jgi:hypothetical protein
MLLAFGFSGSLIGVQQIFAQRVSMRITRAHDPLTVGYRAFVKRNRFRKAADLRVGERKIISCLQGSWMI